MILAPTDYSKAQTKSDVNKLSFQCPFIFYVFLTKTFEHVI